VCEVAHEAGDGARAGAAAGAAVGAHQARVAHAQTELARLTSRERVAAVRATALTGPTRSNQSTTTTTTVQPNRDVPLADAQLSKGERVAIQKLQQETNRVDKNINKDLKKVAKAEKKLAKDMENSKPGKQIYTDQAQLRERKEELNYDFAKKEQLENKIGVVAVGEGNLPINQALSYNTPTYVAMSGNNTTAPMQTSSDPTKRVTTTTTIIHHPSDSSNHSQGTQELQPQHVHPTGFAGSRPEGASSMQGLNPGDKIVESHTEKHTAEYQKGNRDGARVAYS